MNPVVSIVLPTYNGAKYIAKSIESCLSQTYNDIELIIVNDASTDNTSEIINEYAQKDKRITIITNSENKKLPASLNIGFSKAKGELFTWTSDDNIFHHDAIEKMVYFLQSNKDIDMVFANYCFIDENDVVFDYVRLGNFNNLANNNCVGSCFLYKREIQKKLNGYDESLFLVEDWDFWLRASAYFKFSHLDNFLYYHRGHKDSLSHINKEKIQHLSNLVIKKNLSCLFWLLPERKAKLYFRLLKFSLKNKESINAVKYFIRLIFFSSIFIFHYICNRISKKQRNYATLN